MTVSAKPDLFVQLLNFYIFSTLSPVSKEWTTIVSAFWVGIIALDSRKSEIINLYSDYTKSKLQALTFAAITSVCISLQCCNLASNVHHGLANQLRNSVSPVVTYVHGCEREK